jgi:hypothetical protein
VNEKVQQSRSFDLFAIQEVEAAGDAIKPGLNSWQPRCNISRINLDRRKLFEQIHHARPTFSPAVVGIVVVGQLHELDLLRRVSGSAAQELQDLHGGDGLEAEVELEEVAKSRHGEADAG